MEDRVRHGIGSRIVRGPKGHLAAGGSASAVAGTGNEGADPTVRQNRRDNAVKVFTENGTARRWRWDRSGSYVHRGETGNLSRGCWHRLGSNTETCYPILLDAEEKAQIN